MSGIDYDFVDRVKQHQQNLVDMKRQIDDLNKLMVSLEKEFNSLKIKCNHTYPDGRNAVKNGFPYEECPICGW